MASEPVILNVYDLSPLNTYMSTLGVGVFHSGVEVYGQESRTDTDNYEVYTQNLGLTQIIMRSTHRI